MNGQSLTKDETRMLDQLRSFKVPAMVEELEKQLADPNASLSSFSDRVARMISAEWDSRYNKKLNKLLSKAKLRYPAADLDETIHDPARMLDAASIEALNSSCLWIDEGHNLLITGKSSSGKTYLANALCVTAIRNLKSVLYIKASRLISELEKSRINEKYFDYIDSLSKIDLLAIDDFGLMTLDIDKCRDLFEVIDCRDGKRSTIIISQLPVSDWFDLFSENTYADACLTRLTDKRHAYRIVMNGKDMRDSS